VAVAVVLSLMISTTIVGPLRRLRKEATTLLDARGRFTRLFAPMRRRDEIGELGRDLRALAQRLKEQQERAHEFRNPLASIRGATEVLAELDDPVERRRFVAMIESDTARLERLLSGVRELSRIDAGSDGSRAESSDLAILVPQLVDGWRQRHGDAWVLRCAPAGERLHVGLGGDRAAQVVDNLLDNATSFAPRGSTIDIAVEGGEREVRLWVRDHGPGIPLEHRQRVFDRFFSDRPTSLGQNGEPNGAGGFGHTGLGLAIVRANPMAAPSSL
jgi:two-component system sensor histidine kinase ChvG